MYRLGYPKPNTQVFGWVWVTNITHDADRIVNIVVDPKDDRTFGYSYQPASSNNDGSYQFWAFKTEKPAKNTSIVSALREITREEQETKFLSPNAVDDPLNSKPEELQQPPKGSTKDFSEVGVRQKRRKLTESNDQLDEFTESNGITVNQ
ncbi:unnamed protein product, partial [Didymodactylos carnosus]